MNNFGISIETLVAEYAAGKDTIAILEAALEFPKKWFKVYRMKEYGISSYHSESVDLLKRFQNWIVTDEELPFKDGVSQEEYDMLVQFVETAVSGSSIEIYQWVIVCCGDEKR